MERGIGPNWNPERGTKMKTFIINGVEIQAYTETRAMLFYATNKLRWNQKNVRFFRDHRIWNAATRETRTLNVRAVK